MPESGNRYSIATANVLDSSTFGQALTWKIGDHVKMAESSGFDGIELWPQGLIPRVQIDLGIPKDQRSRITSAHQSFRRDKIRSLYDLEVAALLPKSAQSVSHLESIDSQVGGIPVVLYPNVPLETLRGSTIKVKQLQTDHNATYAWNANSAQEFLGEVEKHGFTDEHGNPAVVPDTHHMRHADEATGIHKPLADWRKSLPVLLPFTREVHLGVGRSDYGDMDPKTIRDEARDLLSGGVNNTEVVQMLRLVADSGWKGLVVVEMRPSVIKEVVGSMSDKVLRETYERLRETLYQILDR